MAKKHVPNSVDDVFGVMKQYSEKKGFSFTDSNLKYLAESCYLYFESRCWVGVKYWPAVAMKWVLTNVHSQRKGKYDVRGTTSYKGKMERKGMSVRDKIMEQENDK